MTAPLAAHRAVLAHPMEALIVSRPSARCCIPRARCGPALLKRVDRRLGLGRGLAECGVAEVPLAALEALHFQGQATLEEGAAAMRPLSRATLGVGSSQKWYAFSSHTSALYTWP